MEIRNKCSYSSTDIHQAVCGSLSPVLLSLILSSVAKVQPWIPLNRWFKHLTMADFLAAVVLTGWDDVENNESLQQQHPRSSCSPIINTILTSNLHYIVEIVYNTQVNGYISIVSLNCSVPNLYFIFPNAVAHDMTSIIQSCSRTNLGECSWLCW